MRRRSYMSGQGRHQSRVYSSLTFELEARIVPRDTQRSWPRFPPSCSEGVCGSQCRSRSALPCRPSYRSPSLLGLSSESRANDGCSSGNLESANCDGARDSNAGNPHDAALKLRCPTLNNNGFKKLTLTISFLALNRRVLFS